MGDADADAGLPPPQRNQQGRDRDTETGRFKKAEDEARAKDQKAATSETKNGADTTVEEAQDQDAGAVDEEYFELAPEKDGEEPKRIKASDVWAGYQEAEALRTELANGKRVAPPPIEWDQQMYETVKVRGQIINQFNQWMAANMPAEPDMRLIDPSNPNYNPDLYHLQLTQHRQQMQRIDKKAPSAYPPTWAVTHEFWTFGLKGAVRDRWPLMDTSHMLIAMSFARD